MNLGVMLKTARESALLLVVVIAGISAFEVFFVRAIADLPRDLGNSLLQLAFVKRILQVFLGADLSEHLTSTAVMTIGFASAIPFALTWIFVLTTCSRVVAGEIDRGTADLLLALPASRTNIYCSVSLVWALACVPLAAAPLGGIVLGNATCTMSDPIDFSKLYLLVVNLLALLWAIGGISTLVSALCSRRGPAVGGVLAVLLASFIINFLAQVWQPAENVAFLGLLHYYRPLPIVRHAELPVSDLIVLLGVGVLSWTAGLAYFRRRDIPAA